MNRRRSKSQARGRRRKRKENETTQTVKETEDYRKLFTEFVDYIQNDIDRRDNPNITVSNHWDTTHKFLYTHLHHVDCADDKLHEEIKRFWTGTFLKSTKNPSDEGYIHRVEIPLTAIEGFQPLRKAEKKVVRFSKDDNEAPSCVTFLLIVIFIMFNVLATVFLTTKDDWLLFFSMKK